MRPLLHLWSPPFCMIRISVAHGVTTSCSALSFGQQSQCLVFTHIHMHGRLHGRYWSCAHIVRHTQFAIVVLSMPQSAMNNKSPDTSAIVQSIMLRPYLFILVACCCPCSSLCVANTSNCDKIMLQADPMGDLSTEIERELGKLVKAKYHTDFYILHSYPLAVSTVFSVYGVLVNPTWLACSLRCCQSLGQSCTARTKLGASATCLMLPRSAQETFVCAQCFAGLHVGHCKPS